MKYINSLTLLFLSLFSVIAIHAQVEGETQGKYWNLDQGISNWQGQDIEISNKRYKVGSHSVKWQWKNGAEILINQPKGLSASFNVKQRLNNSLYAEQDNSVSEHFSRVGGVMCWIYNEKPTDDYVKIEFGKGALKAYQFSFYLNYSGWRACWVRFMEMEELAEVEDLDYMKFIAPTNKDSGTLYFDRIVFSGKPIHWRSTPDQQLPFINPKVNLNHWGGQWYWETQYKHDISLENTVTEAQKKAFRLMEEKLFEMFKGAVPSQDENWYYKDNFEDFRIVRHQDSSVSGRPIVSSDEYDPLLNDIKPKHLGAIFMGLAKGYVRSDDDLCEKMFIDLFDHFLDQGYNYGSSTGTQHHYGYQFERIAESFFLMKDALKDSGRMHKASKMLAYWYGNAEHKKDKKANEMQGVADLWNTKIMGRFIAVLLMEDTPGKVREMKALSRFLDNSLEYSSGSVGGIKPDGSLYHHAGLYPAYMAGSFLGLAPVVYALADTPFSLKDTSVNHLKQSLLLMRTFSNKYDWPIALSGRQPFAGKISQGVINAMGYIAMSEKETTEMAPAYMRLANSSDEFYTHFLEQGIQLETNLNGFTAVNYACMGLHRRDDWLVSVKGYSKYIWSSEIYKNDNRWGRYMGYGTIQINNTGNPINGKDSGWHQNGWDWNRFPGTTAIHLPLNKLYCPVSKLAARTDETFSGSASFKKTNGIWGMKLHEYLQLENFTPDHRARKSVFFFDDCIVALGSNIENRNKDYPTETTLFQLEASKNATIKIDKERYSQMFNLKLNSNTSHVIGDNKGNTYFIPKGQKLKIAKQKQISKHNKSERTTEGVFGVAYFNHGKAPLNAAYEYAIMVNGQKTDGTPKYKVLQKDKNAHIVFDEKTNITGLVLFEAGKVQHEIIKAVNHESLVMLKREKEMLTLSVCSPSINLGSNKSYDSKGSIPVSIALELDGNWSLSKNYSKCTVKKQLKGKTILQFECTNGETIEVLLKKKI